MPSQKQISTLLPSISLVTDEMPVISVATQEELLEKMVSNIVEVKSRGAFTITVCKKGTEFNEGVMDEIIDNVVPNFIIKSPISAKTSQAYVFPSKSSAAIN